VRAFLRFREISARGLLRRGRTNGGLNKFCSASFAPARRTLRKRTRDEEADAVVGEDAGNSSTLNAVYAQRTRKRDD